MERQKKKSSFETFPFICIRYIIFRSQHPPTSTTTRRLEGKDAEPRTCDPQIRQTPALKSFNSQKRFTLSSQWQNNRGSATKYLTEAHIFIGPRKSLLQKVAKYAGNT